jgi:hypothetical protein
MLIPRILLVFCWLMGRPAIWPYPALAQINMTDYCDARSTDVVHQGLNLLHDFWDYESARAFEESVRVDPQCAMCY